MLKCIENYLFAEWKEKERDYQNQRAADLERLTALEEEVDRNLDAIEKAFQEVVEAHKRYDKALKERA